MNFRPTTFLSIGACLFMTANTLLASQLVSDQTIKIQNTLTHDFKLNNGLPVTYREIPGSDIIEFSYTFRWGRAYQSPKQKTMMPILFSTMPKAAEGWSKDKVFATIERYSARVSCGGGIEVSECSLGTVSDYWHDLLPLMAAIITKPMLNDEDIKLAVDGEESQTQQYIQDPDDYVNDVVNDVFYPADHPYRLQAKDILKELKKQNRKDLLAVHKKMLTESLQHIVVVGNLPIDQLTKDLNTHFGSLPLPTSPVEVLAKDPVFKKGHAFKFVNKDIPTAYISMKMNLPGSRSELEPAVRLLFSILTEELMEEVRTKQSLSYAVHAGAILHEVGIGVITASTSKPKETFAAIMKVVDKLKNTAYTDRQLDNHKTKFVTAYFLTLESHDYLADALARTLMFHDNASHLYQMPRLLDKISPKDISSLAQKYLTNFRIGVIFNKSKFKDTWAEEAIKASES